MQTGFSVTGRTHASSPARTDGRGLGNRRPSRINDGERPARQRGCSLSAATALAEPLS